jgi:hypothetical protein
MARLRTAPTHPHLLRFLVTDEERAALEAAALVRGVPLSEILREGLRAVTHGSLGSSGVRRLA